MDTEARELSSEILNTVAVHYGYHNISVFTRTITITDIQTLVLKWAEKDFISEIVRQKDIQIESCEEEIEVLRERLKEIEEKSND